MISLQDPACGQPQWLRQRRLNAASGRVNPHFFAKLVVYLFRQILSGLKLESRTLPCASEA